MIYDLSSLLNNSGQQDKYITIQLVQESFFVRHALSDWFGQRSLKKAYITCPHHTAVYCLVLRFCVVS